MLFIQFPILVGRQTFKLYQESDCRLLLKTTSSEYTVIVMCYNGLILSLELQSWWQDWHNSYHLWCCLLRRSVWMFRMGSCILIWQTHAFMNKNEEIIFWCTDDDGSVLCLVRKVDRLFVSGLCTYLISRWLVNPAKVNEVKCNEIKF